MCNKQFVITVLSKIAEKIEEQKDFLTDLDRPIGDSDHGINLARGFSEVKKKLSQYAEKEIADIVRDTGMTLVSNVGGASGPLYGSAFMKAAKAFSGKTEISIADFIAGMEMACDAVMQRGKAAAEEATMLDAMIPALAAMKKTFAENKNPARILSDGVKAAWDGVSHTKNLIATKGRASYVGERGLGHQDPGATSFAFMLETVKNEYEIVHG